MLVNAIAALFVAAFIVIVVLGHILLFRAAVLGKDGLPRLFRRRENALPTPTAREAARYRWS